MEKEILERMNPFDVFKEWLIVLLTRFEYFKCIGLTPQEFRTMGREARIREDLFISGIERAELQDEMETQAGIKVSVMRYDVITLNDIFSQIEESGDIPKMIDAVARELVHEH